MRPINEASDSSPLIQSDLPPDIRDDGGVGLSPDAIMPGQFFTALVATKEFSAGALVLVTAAAPNEISYTCAEAPGWTFTLPYVAFRERFASAPDGEAQLQGAIAAAVTALSARSPEAQALAAAVEQLQPTLGGTTVTPAGSAGDTPTMRALPPVTGDDRALPPVDHAAGSDRVVEPAMTSVSGMGLTLVMGGTAVAPATARQQVAGARNAIAKAQKSMQVRQRQLSALLGLQAKALELQMERFKSALRQAEELIWTINLYLGKDVELHQIAEGEPATAEDRIAIQQLVLYMDEECALSGERGGIDAEEIERFDAWVIRPENLARVCPSPKGVVAFHVRRNEKDYGDAWLNAQMGEANAQTYFLMRNGGNVYRIWSDALQVGTHLVPRSDEFEELFWRRPWHSGFGERTHEREPLDPGSQAYVKAMDSANAKQRHYMRIALFLQGLLDRTEIFHPLPAPRVNILNVQTQEQYVQFVMDGEFARQIGAGRPPFREWLRQVNESMDVGRRVIGVFGHWTRGVVDDWSRIRPWKCPPRHRWHRDNTPRVPEEYLPDSKMVHTIAGKERDGTRLAFVLRYPRRDDVLRRGEGFVTPSTNASCRVHADDAFVLHLDGASIEDIRFYLNNRVDRHDYEYMWPLLQRALALKEAEEAAEAPFRTLLAGELLKTYGVDLATADAAVAELVPWWKFKNQTHRALVADEAKVVRMIVDEFGIRQARSAERDAADDASLIEALRAAEPDALLIAHVKGREYIVLVPENDEPVFVREISYRVAGRGSRAGEAVRGNESRWRVVDQRRARWGVRYTGPRWTGWLTDVRASDWLTDDERAVVERLGWARFERRAKHRYRYEHEQGYACFFPLCTTVDEKGTLRLFAQEQRLGVPDALVAGRIAEPDLSYAEIAWKRTKGGLTVEITECSVVLEVRPWDPAAPDRFRRRGKNARTLWRDDANIAQYEADMASIEVVQERKRRIERRVERTIEEVRTVWAEALIAAAKAAFLAKDGDPELWPDEYAVLDEKHAFHAPYLDWARRAITAHADRGLPMAGRTVGEMLEAARAWGIGPKDDDRDREGLPLSHVLSDAVDATLSEDEDDEDASAQSIEPEDDDGPWVDEVLDG